MSGESLLTDGLCGLVSANDLKHKLDSVDLSNSASFMVSSKRAEY